MNDERIQAEIQAAINELVTSGAEIGLQVAVIKNGRVVADAVLLHTAGVPGLPPGTIVGDLCDWDHMCAVLADEQLWWEAGTCFGYDAKTFGFLLGEIMRRATGRTISTFLRDVVTGPLGIEDDVHFGVPQPLLPRFARQVASDDPVPDLPEPGSPLDRAMPRGVLPDAEYANRSDVLTSDIPSEGTMTARGVARMYSALLGHVDDVPLVSSRRLASMAAVAFTGMDQVMASPPRGRSGTPGPSWQRSFAARSTFGMVGMTTRPPTPISISVSR